MIYYSHVNEDNKVEESFMNSATFENLVGISGSGERVIALMAHPYLKKVAAVDTNVEALFLLELKLIALEYLSIEKYLEFIGYSKSSSRWEIFVLIKKELSAPCKEYWEKQPNAIKNGILFCGHFEKFLERNRPLFKLFLGKNFYKCFEKPIQDISSFPTWRWYLVKSIFSQRWAFRLTGNKDIAFVSSDAECQHIPKGLQKVMDENLVSQSFMFHLVFKGHLNEMNPEALPPSLKIENLKKIKQALQENRIEVSYHENDITMYLQKYSRSIEGHTFYSLSDILSFYSFSNLESLLNTISKNENEKHWGVVRAFVRNRLGEKELSQLRKRLGELIESTHLERTKMYQTFNFKIKK